MKTNILSKLIGAVVVLLVLIYIFFQAYSISSPSYKTTVAVMYQVSDQISAEGTVVRDEFIEDSVAGVKYYLVSNGDKVAAGSTVAEQYQDSQDAINGAYLDLLVMERDVLQQILEGRRGGANLASLHRSINYTLASYKSTLNSEDYSTVGQDKVNLLSVLESYGAAAGKESDVSKRLDEVNVAIHQYSLSSQEADNSIHTQHSGYFISFTDNCESVFSTETLFDLDASTLMKNIQKSHDQYSYSDSHFKILSNYNWYYVCQMPKSDSLRLKNDYLYLLSFDHSNVIDLPARVRKIVPGEGETDYDVVIFEFERLNPDVALLRNEDVTIHFSNYKGIRVDRESLRLIDGKLGVYIKYGDTVAFRELDIIYETEDYVLSSVTEGSASVLSLYDEIITSGKDLYINKKLT